jgi:SAM-dependent methyltransferase
MAVEATRNVIRKLGRLRGTGDGRLPGLGHDYDTGHRAYVEQLREDERLWLRTKPFSAPPSFELRVCFRTFAHIVERLDLGIRAQVLDVGCGPGWLSEFLARCGFWVTGVDISEGMVEIARERVAKIPPQGAEGFDPLAEFHAMPVREMPWSDRFDAAILFDTMHHFDDELKTLRVIQRTLVPGGRVYIREGTRPASGSPDEQNLIEEMRRHGTLESPFDPRYLVEVVDQAGFVDVHRFMEIDELIDVSNAGQAGRALKRYLEYRLGRGDVNTVIARKPTETSVTDAEDFAARLELRGVLTDEQAREVLVGVAVTNTGSAFWPAASSLPSSKGIVSVGPYVRDAHGGRIELPRAPLPRGIAPGETVEVQLRIPRDQIGSRSEIEVDVVREGLAWFGDLGSPTLTVALGN